MHEVRTAESSTVARSDFLRTVGVAALVLTALWLIYHLALARSGSSAHLPGGWGLFYYFLASLELGVSVSPAVSFSERTREWRVGALAGVLTFGGVWLSYALVLTLLFALVGAEKITVIFGLTRQDLIGTWTAGAPVSLILGLVLGVISGFAGVHRRAVRDQ